MGAVPPSPAQAAEALASRGQLAEALELLKNGAANGDADAAFMLAAWCLSGRHVRRDLVAARQLFGRAAAAGHGEAEAIFIAFLANGTGGGRAWPEALRLLAERSSADANAREEIELLEAMQLTSDGEPVRVPKPETLSSRPCVTLYRGLFTRFECDYLIKAASPFFTRSVVVHPDTGRLIEDPVRNSDVAAFPLAYETPAIHALNRRLAAISATDPAQGEPLQILRYQSGQQYKAHSDALPNAANQRICTALVYLNDDYAGGETHFLANDLKVRGAAGDAILFANADREGRPYADARHAGLPVTRGTKLLASRWIRARPLDLSISGAAGA
jgi:prolyl 4-hydroxylase